MQLSAFRELFIRESGRYDLVNDNGSDNGANFYINAGQRHLDRLTQHSKSQALNYQILPDNRSVFFLPNCRTVHSVSYVQTKAFNLPSQTHHSTYWRPLVRMTMPALRRHYFGGPKGLPQAYALAVTRGTQDTMNENDYTIFNAMADMIDIVMGSYYEKIAVLLMPIPDQPISVEVEGLFYSAQLVEETDQSFWTTNHPELLLQASLRELEVVHRNTQGVRDWDQAIQTSTMLIEQDHVYDEAYHVTKMRG